VNIFLPAQVLRRSADSEAFRQTDTGGPLEDQAYDAVYRQRRDIAVFRTRIGRPGVIVAAISMAYRCTVPFGELRQNSDLNFWL
jgi:hypothetical protein